MLKRKAILFYFVPPQQPSTPKRETKREARLPLKTMHMVDGNDVTPPKIICRGTKLVSMNT